MKCCLQGLSKIAQCGHTEIHSNSGTYEFHLTSNQCDQMATLLFNIGANLVTLLTIVTCGLAEVI